MMNRLTEEQKQHIVNNCNKYNINELAEMLDIDKKKVRNYINNKKLKYKRFPIGASKDLTKTEMKIFELMATGYSDEMICKKLILSKTTVKTHIMNIIAKKYRWKNIREKHLMRLRIILDYHNILCEEANND